MPPLTQYALMVWCSVEKHRDFTFVVVVVVVVVIIIIIIIIIRSLDSSVVWRYATGWMIAVLVPAGAGNFFSSPPRLEPAQPPTQCVSGALSLRVKRPEREAGYSYPSIVEVKNA
jgi:hypothetical protein